ncbi:hypothetical protein [Williamsia sp.]
MSKLKFGRCLAPIHTPVVADVLPHMPAESTRRVRSVLTSS